jgi:DNA-binding transcriptional regulator GbsR (MarR family)
MSAATVPTPVVSAKTLPESKALFIRRWGEMSSYWGINRTMAEIHALSYVSTEPICTDDVMALLQVSRGNASMNLRSLVDWGLIQRVHVRGDRKEYFSALTDVWQMFETIIRQRKRREVEPIVETIHRCREMAAKEMSQSKGARSPEIRAYLRRLEDMNTFLRVLGTTMDLLLKVGPKGMDRVSGLMMKIAG